MSYADSKVSSFLNLPDCRFCACVIKFYIRVYVLVFMQIQFFKQQKFWTCGPASLRMVLGAFGIKKSEKELIPFLVKKGEPGTPNRSLSEVAERLKLNYVVRRNASIADIRWYLSHGFGVIVSYFDSVEEVGHFAVVKRVGLRKIHLFDPWYGPKHEYSLKQFLPNWRSGFDKDKRWFIAIKKPKK